jgi:citrate synthase
MRGQFTSGFGHGVYKNYDPRARIIKWTAYTNRGRTES